MREIMKSTICITLILSLMIGTTITASASGGIQAIEDKNAMKELEEYEKICVFSIEEVNEDISTYARERESRRDNVEQAIQGVLDLELGSMGYQYVEDACLAELEEISGDTDLVLEEYNVLLPKNRASTPSYYGTYYSRDYYSMITSTSYTKESVEWSQKFAKGDVILQWIQNAVSLAFCFGGDKIATIPYTLLTAQLPTSYTIHKDSWMNRYCNVNSMNRAVYAKEGNNYVLLINREFGIARPYVVYHLNDATASIPTITLQFGDLECPDAISGTSKQNVLKMAKSIYESGALPVTYKLSKTVAVRFMS